MCHMMCASKEERTVQKKCAHARVPGRGTGGGGGAGSARGGGGTTSVQSRVSIRLDWSRLDIIDRIRRRRCPQ
jgi:hypothetical protein